MTNTDLPELDSDAQARIEGTRRNGQNLVIAADGEGHRTIRFAADCAIGFDSDLISYARNQAEEVRRQAQTGGLLLYFNVMTYEYFVVTPVVAAFEALLDRLDAKARRDFPGSAIDLEPQKKAWVSRATGRKILREARGDRVNATYWQDLQAQFHALGCPHLCAVPGNGWWHIDGVPNEPTQRDRILQRLSFAIHRAVTGLGLADQSVETAAWLDRLKEVSPHYANQCINNLALASVEYCLQLERPIGEAGQPRPMTKPSACAKQTVKLKPGPKRDETTAFKVLGIVQRLAGNQHWKTKLEEICEELDRAGIPLPKSWMKKQQLESWVDAAQLEPSLAKKAITYRLKVAQA